ncbi:hypothetical protein Tco_1294201 [Tanacetum coccineum]
MQKSSWPFNSLGAQVEVIKTLENSCPIGWFGIAKLSMRPCGCGVKWELWFLAWCCRFKAKTTMNSCLAEQQYNLAYFFVKRIESARATPKAHLPYGMFLTRLFRHVMELYPHLDNGIYDVVERVMRPLALRQTRRPRSDRGKARHSVSSTSAHHNRGSSSHQGDDDEDDGASRASTPSPTTYLNSLKPLNYQPYQIPSPSQKNDDLLFERQTEFLNQSQEIHKEARGGFKSFGKAL